MSVWLPAPCAALSPDTDRNGVLHMGNDTTTVDQSYKGDKGKKKKKKKKEEHCNPHNRREKIMTLRRTRAHDVVEHPIRLLKGHTCERRPLLACAFQRGRACETLLHTACRATHCNWYYTSIIGPIIRAVLSDDDRTG